MRILIVTPEYPPDYGGGIVTYYRELVPALQSIGHEVDVLVGSAFTHKVEQADKGGVAYLESERFYSFHNRFSSFELFPSIQKFLAAAFAIHDQCKGGEGYDIVEVADWGMLFVPWLLKAECKVLVQMHGSTGQISHFDPMIGCEIQGMFELMLEIEILRKHPNLSSYSHSNCQWWSKKLGCEVQYVPPALQVTEDGTSYCSVIKDWVTAGRIQAWKGPVTACKSWRMMENKAPPLNWYGRDTIYNASGEPTSHWLEQNFPDVWTKSIIPKGQVHPEQLRKIISEAHTVLIPSIWDVFNFVGAEAMCTGKVLVASTGAGVSDLIDHGVNGFKFENTPESLMQCVLEVQSLNDSRRLDIGKAAKETIANKLAPSKVAKAKSIIYEGAKRTDPKDDWLQMMSMEYSKSTRGAFLNNFPLKRIFGHMVRRCWRKGLGRFYHG